MRQIIHGLHLFNPGTLRAWVLVLGVLVGMTAPALAQTRGKIAGKVTDAATGEPLYGVNVVIVGTTIGMSTDLQGDYYIANLDPGTYSIQASIIGYQDVVIEEVRVNMNRTTEINIEMREAAIEGEEIVVTADRPLVEADRTSSTLRLETEQVTELPTTSFTEVLATLPSINVENGQVLVRGGTLDQVAFVVDGARARNPLDHSPYTRFNLSAIEEVEVITGAFNAEYGEAQSGVVNVITKEGSQQYELYVDARYQPPGLKHWGMSFYDRSTELYWENTHARHLEWWIENPDQWVDPNGIPGTDPRSIWTAEQAYQNFIDTHQPLTDYTQIPTVQTEMGFGGPLPFLDNFTFFATGKYRSEPPLFGNAFRDRGEFLDGTLKLTYRMGNGRKLQASGFFGTEKAGWGYGNYPDFFWALNFGLTGRYAYNDFEGFPNVHTNGQTLRYSHALNASTLYEIEVNRVQALRSVDVLPGDPIGWEAQGPTLNFLRAVDASGNPVVQGYSTPVGYHTSGYYYRYDDDNVEWSTKGYISSQINKTWFLKSGFDFSYYVLDHYNEAKLPERYDDRTYRPYQGAAYVHNKFEFEGFIMNAGLRLDFYNANDTLYTDLFNPLAGETEKTKLYAQVSPRLGVSHPIDANTVLHFSYGHFFQRPSFGDYGEGGGAGSLTTFIPVGSNLPWVLGNRNLRPMKTIAYEVGIERNFWDVFVLDLTGYYKDSRNTVRQITIETPLGTYTTNGNGNYSDVRGVELGLRMNPRSYGWGRFWGYASYTTQFGISGRSGDPSRIGPDGVVYPPSGDVLRYYNPWFKAGAFYQTPGEWRGWKGRLLGNLSVSLDYQASFPNDQIRSDYFLFDNEKHLRPVDQSTDLRARKQIEFAGVRLSPYLEVQNLFNNRWLFLGAFERASQADQRRFVESGFDELPDYDANGVLILDVAKFRNLPRQIIFGVTMEL